MAQSKLTITLEFAGGAELLFDKVKKRQLELPALATCVKGTTEESRWQIKHLLRWMETNLLRERPELFLQQDSVRPGILVLVNDADWELYGQLEYELQQGDCILFISTLHGPGDISIEN